MYCTNCGCKISNNDECCNNCGYKLKNSVQNVDCVKEENTMHLNKSEKPLTTMQFFLIQILFLIPVINWFFIIYWSLKSNINKNLKSYARSKLVWTIGALILLIFMATTFIFINFILR